MLVGNSGIPGKQQLSCTSLADNMSVGLLMLDAEGAYTYANCAAEKFLGLPRPKIVTHQAKAVMHPLRMPLLIAMDVLKHGKRPLVAARLAMNGRMVMAEFSRTVSRDGGYEGLAVVMRDTTDECEFCGNLMRAERMTVLGELAAAMAHEINSPLGGIMESVRIIRKNMDKREKVERFLSLAQQGLEQIEATVKQMLRLATPQTAPMTSLVLEEVITQCVEFLHYRQAETPVDFKLDLTTERTMVNASSHSLSQVLINLINNAFDAAEGSPGASVTVRSEILPGSGEVMVQVIDNGPGIPPQLRSRIFEPFFTTRPSGKGTGLGLPISARIAARHGGRIIVSQSESWGAVFSLVLPVVSQGDEDD